MAGVLGVSSWLGKEEQCIAWRFGLCFDGVVWLVCLGWWRELGLSVWVLFVVFCLCWRVVGVGGRRG